MKKRTILLLVYLFTSFAGYCVSPLWAWQHNLNASIADITYHNNYLYTCGTFSGGSFVFGNANISNQGGNDAILMKWDTSGNLIWASSIFGSADEALVSIKVNALGELIVAGHSNSTTINVAGNILASNGGNDIFIAKYDLNGSYLSAFIYGTAANEYSLDMCTDNSNNMYVASNSNITKYTIAGVLVWQRQLLANEVFFSTVDNTVVATGYFTNALTLGNFSIVADYSVNWGVQPDIYAAKLSLGNTPLWIHNISNDVRGDFALRSGLNEQTGKLYVAYSRLTLALDEIMTIREISYLGVISNQAISLSSSESMRCTSMSTYDSLLSFRISSMGAINYIYNTNNLQEIKNYELSDYAVNNYFQCIRGLNALYTHSGNNIQLGKISGALLTGYPTNQTLNFCQGSTAVLSGNITGGVGALTYSWLPVTGLNNTNSNTVSFTATSNISYTLTVTDGIGQVAKDTFDINVQTTIPPANITSQFPLLCDTMELYANNGVPGVWHYVIGNSWYSPPGQIPGNGLIQKIIQAGRYMYVANNSCGWRYDSIDIAAVLTAVTANVTDDTICEGQSVIFTGGGALNYTWTNGVTDNVPFTPTYTPFAIGYIVTGSDANGCLGKDTVKVKVYQNVNVSNNLSICANQTPYSWNGQNLDTTGVYTANFTSVGGCDSIATLNLTLSPCIVCVPSFTINYSPFYNSLTESQSWIVTSGTVLIAAGTKVKLDAHQTSFVLMNPGFKADSGSIFIAQAYNGCTAGAPQLPNAKIFTGETSAAADEIVLYPNPTAGMIHIRHDEKLTGIQIFDMVGKLVVNQKCTGETETNIDLSNLPDGVYHVKAAGYNSVKVVKSLLNF